VNVLLFADVAPADPSAIELGLIAVTLLLTVAAVVFGLRVLRRMNTEETNPDSEAKP
jgi:hypothetical protein